MAKDLEDVLSKKVNLIVDEAVKQKIGFSIKELSEDLVNKIRRIPFLEIDIDISFTFRRAKSQFLKKFITRLLATHLGNISEASIDANVERRTIHRLIKKFKIPIQNIRKEMTKRRYLKEQNVVSVIATTLKQYEKSLHPRKIKDLLNYAPILSHDIVQEIPSRTLTISEAEELFERYYFKELLKKYKTITQAAMHAGIRPETLHRKIKTLCISGKGKDCTQQ